MAVEVVQIEGFEDVLRALRAAPVEMRKQLIAAVVVSKETLQRRIAAAAPRRTGSLRGAIATTKAKSLTGWVGITDAPVTGGIGGVDNSDRRPEIYWRFVEFGTEHTPAQPFIRPTTDAYAPKFLERVKRAAKDTERILNQQAIARAA